MRLKLIVVQQSEAFGQLWDRYAGQIEADLLVVRDAQEAAGLPAVATILACGGAERVAVDGVHDALRAGLTAPIVVGAEEDHRLAIQLIQAGAADYFALPGDAGRLEAALADRVTRVEPSVSVDLPSDYDFGAIIGEHPRLRAALDRAAKVIPGGMATVLLLGETGTGKELFARAIHDNGPRSRAPFVAVNCSAVPATLLESELFGHEKGSFTDARSAKPGLFEVADGGTVFLDEVASMPIEMQAKLLRFLEDRQVRRLGSVSSRPVDIRILAAAHDDLPDLVRSGGFREDLYYRLAVVPIVLPPLRDRGEDVLLLARFFLAQTRAEYGLETAELSAQAKEAIRGHHWPGNVRELKNAIERGLLLSGGGPISVESLGIAEGHIGRGGGGSDESATALPFPTTLEHLERAAAAATLELYNGNKSKTAKTLGITRSRLYRILARDGSTDGL